MTTRAGEPGSRLAMAYRPAGARADEGFATVFGLGLLVVILVVTYVVGAFAAITVARHRAESAADLGAITAARHALEGADSACAAARRVVEVHQGSLVGCRLDGVDAVIEVTVRPPGRLGALGVTRARARAGIRS